MRRKIFISVSFGSLILAGLFLKSFVIFYAAFYLALSINLCRWSLKTRTLIVLLSLMIAGALYYLETSRDNRDRQHHSMKRSNDTCTMKNLPPFTAYAPEYSSAESIHCCHIEITDTKDLPSYYATPSAGWRNFTEENITAIVAAMDSLKEFVFIARKCADIEIQRRISSTLYTVFKREARLESGNRDRYTLQLTSAISKPVRPDYFYWYQSSFQPDPYLKKGTFAIILVVAALFPIITINTRRSSFFRLSFLFPPIVTVFTTYFFVIQSASSAAAKSFILFFVPITIISIYKHAGRFISVKTGMLIFALWCFSYYIYREQITDIISSRISGIFFGGMLGAYLLFTLAGMPRAIQSNFRMNLAGIGTGYALLTLHNIFPSSLFYSLAIFLLILSQTYGIGRMRRII